jgi:PhoH-like ATPase
LKHAIGNDADNRIINYALHLQNTLKQDVSIVSCDINMWLKARTIGVDAEDVLVDNQILDIDLLFTGVQSFTGDLFYRYEEEKDFAMSGKSYRFNRDIFNNEAQPNMYWYDGFGHVGKIKELKN